MQPVQPGWDDLISLSSAGTTHQVQVAALYTPLRMIARQPEDGGDGKFAVSFQPYIPADVRPLGGDDDFHLQSQCMVHLAPADASRSPDPEGTSTDSICLFLYEVRSTPALPPSSVPCLLLGLIVPGSVLTPKLWQSTTRTSSSAICRRGKIPPSRATVFVS